MPDTCFVTCPAGLEKLLADELQGVGCQQLRRGSSGVQCQAELTSLYRICLYSRIANRVLYPLLAFRVESQQDYYAKLFEFAWEEVLKPEASLAIDFFASESAITHTRYGAQLTKDAIVDRFRAEQGKRPSVDRFEPGIRINVYLYKNRARVSVDLAGRSLHMRGYRAQSNKAPLKENLAAALLHAAGWPTMANRGLSLHDPMCGSGTFLIEAALMASNTAPGLLRDYFGFFGWQGHDDALWSELREAAKQARKPVHPLPRICGADIDPVAVAVARENIAQAGFEQQIEVRQADFLKTESALFDGPGLLIVNPPYGERLQDKSSIPALYSGIGRVAKRFAAGTRLAFFSGSPALFHRTGLSRKVALECKNGDLDCKLFVAELPQKLVAANAEPAVTADTKASAESHLPGAGLAAQAVEEIHNRLRKNFQKLSGWARSADISCFRLYDADLPDFAVAVDLYREHDSPRRWLASVQEYRAPAHIDPVLAHKRLQAAAQAVLQVTGSSAECIAVKSRAAQRKDQQYQRLQRRDQYNLVAEGQARLLINLHDYLDTGLFLDHRKIRSWIAGSSAGVRLLNLFCYTASATVHSALGGAASSLSIDLSPRYLEWAGRNLAANSIDPARHELLAADCHEWISSDAAAQAGPFDIIFLDPPTFSNSARTDHDWDVQRDHASMIESCMALLAQDGVLIFSTNFRRFRLEQKLASLFVLEDRSQWSIQRDFSRNRRIHKCWFFRHRTKD